MCERFSVVATLRDVYLRAACHHHLSDGSARASAVRRNLCSLVLCFIVLFLYDILPTFLLSNRIFRGCCVALVSGSLFCPQPNATQPNPTRRSVQGPSLCSLSLRRNIQVCAVSLLLGRSDWGRPELSFVWGASSVVLPSPLKEEGANGDLD